MKKRVTQMYTTEASINVVEPSLKASELSYIPRHSNFAYVHCKTQELLNGRFNIDVIANIGAGYSGYVLKCAVVNATLPDNPSGLELLVSDAKRKTLVNSSTVQERSGDQEVPRVEPLEYNDRLFAMKILSKAKIRAKMVEREVEMLRKGRAPNVLQFLLAVECVDSYWLMTEYCGRGDLFSMLRQLDNALIMTRHYMMDVVNGLECLHNKYIAHSDIKMKNILITDNNIAKIADFGFAKRYSSDEDVERISRGTRDYWAPEMRVVRLCFNPFKTDIYALGVTFVGACIKRPVKRKCDDIKDIVRKFEDPGQASLFHGLLRSDPKKRLEFHMIKANFWLTEHLSTSPE